MSKEYYIEFVRIEHNIYRDTVIADSKEEAEQIFMDTIIWDQGDCVHAEEYFETVKEVGDK